MILIVTTSLDLRLRNKVSGPEIVNLSGQNNPVAPQKLLEKVTGEAPTFSKGFCGRRGPLRLSKSSISGPEVLLRNPKYPTSVNNTVSCGTKEQPTELQTPKPVEIPAQHSEAATPTGTAEPPVWRKLVA